MENQLIGVDMSKALAIAVLLILLMPINASAAPKAELWPFWEKSNQSSLETISHNKWQKVLDGYLEVNSADGIHRFNYAAVSSADKALLESYLTDLQKIDPREYSRPEQFAYWVNLYNALTIDLVLEHYPVPSIKKIRYWSSLFGPWNKKTAKIVGKSLSLNDIEHRILRPIWKDPRIHFVVNCASLGCPNLLPKAISAKDLEGQLKMAKEHFLRHPRAIRIEGELLILSSLFDWYSADFGGSQAKVIAYVESYLDGQPSKPLDPSMKIKYEYDWALNTATSQ